MQPMISYAQNFEDVMLRRALQGVTNGFYVDVGAWDPNMHSVTKHFYDSGWRGINIEPIPTYRSMFETLRPNDLNLFVAIGKANGRCNMTQIDGTGMSSLVVNEAVKKTAEKSYTSKNIQVEMRTLNSVFDEFAPSVVHFLKVDCEGSEGDALNNFDLSRHRPWIILVEAVEPLTNEPNHDVWEHNLIKNDYRFVYFDGLNRFYTASERAELSEAFSVPPNVFDNFKSLMFAPTAEQTPEKKSWWKRQF